MNGWFYKIMRKDLIVIPLGLILVALVRGSSAKLNGSYVHMVILLRARSGLFFFSLKVDFFLGSLQAVIFRCIFSAVFKKI